ncbi:GtrA family protein [Paraburkholderia sp.]|uniref:GtrA family protein n=1 Tax=Paraburkholderia sp. TaxID=1926495 RepID=UPI003D6DC47D
MRDAASLKRFAAYIAVGAAGTAVQYAALFAGTAAGWATPATASAVGAALGAAVNYWLNHLVTFRESRSDARNGARDHVASIPKFFATALAGVALTWCVMHAMTQQLHVPILIAQLIATALSLAMTYTVNSAWTFRQRPDAHEPSHASADTTLR